MVRMNSRVAFVLSVVSAVTSTASTSQTKDEVLKAIVFPTEATDHVEIEEDGVELPDWVDVDLDKLPMDKMSLLNSLNNLTELAELFGLTKEQQDKLENDSQMQLQEEDSGVSFRSDSLIGNDIPHDAVFASCKPEMEVVELDAPPGTAYVPQCVRLLRCGGCCAGGSLLSCQPTKSEPVKCRVMKLNKSKSKTSGRRGGTRGRYSIVNQVNHVKCSCQCRTKEHHCDKNTQDYKASECACICKNREEESKCHQKSTHYWDNRICSCRCKTTLQCSRGEYFDQGTCSCVREVIFGL